MPDGQEAALAMEVSRVFALEHRIVEHGGGAHKVDAEFLQVAGATRLFPLEHTPLPTQQAARQHLMWRGKGLLASRFDRWATDEA